MGYDAFLARRVLAACLTDEVFAAEALPLLDRVGMGDPYEQSILEYVTQTFSRTKALPDFRMWVLWLDRKWVKREDRDEVMELLDNLVSDKEQATKATLDDLRRFVQRAHIEDGINSAVRLLGEEGQELDAAKSLRQALDRFDEQEKTEDEPQPMSKRIDGLIADLTSVDLSPRVPFPLRRLTEITGGGLKDQVLCNVTASTDVGKSAFLADCAYTVVVQSDACVFWTSSEEAKREIELRLLARHSRVSRGVLDNPNRFTAEYQEIVRNRFNGRWAEFDDRITIYSVPMGGYVETLVPVVRKWRKKHAGKFLLLVLDGADEMAVRGKYNSIWERQAALMRMLRDRVVKDPELAPVAVISTVQQDRSRQGKAPRLEKVRGAFEAATLANVVLGLQDRGPMGERDDTRRMTVLIQKNKLGSKTVKKVFARGDLDLCEFVDCDESEGDGNDE